jgi:hypothetical protein
VGMRFKTEQIDASFFDAAPNRYVDSMEIPRPVADVWADLTVDHPLPWCRVIKEISWTSARPFGEGTTRTARALGGALVIDEVFFRWEEGRRQTFSALGTSLPMFNRFGEDYLLEPVSDSRCRFTWTIAAEPKPLAKPGNPINAALLGSLFSDTRKHYGAV